MNQEDFLNAYILLISGAAELRGNEIKWKIKRTDITIEFPTLEPTCAIVRRYYAGGNKCWEEKYRNGVLHGKAIMWYENGNKYRECNWANGLWHGKAIGWDENGNKSWECAYRNGVKIK